MIRIFLHEGLARQRMRITLLILASLFAVALNAAAKRAITPSAMRSWKIVCDSGATESERYAATEFQRLFKEMTGAMLPVTGHAVDFTFHPWLLSGGFVLGLLVVSLAAWFPANRGSQLDLPTALRMT